MTGWGNAPGPRSILAATALSYVLVILDTSVVNVALERIAASLGTGIAGLQWVASAYTLSFASLLLTGGALGDRWGARNTYLAGLGVFTLASALCGLATGLPALVAARAMQGIGAALLVPAALLLIDRGFPDPKRRTAAIGLWAGLGGVAMAAGPLVGGLLIEGLGWRGVFLVNIPLGLLGMALTSQVAEDGVSGAVRALDLPGQVSGIVALASLIAALIEGPRQGWTAWPILTGLALSAMAVLAFVFLERWQEHSILPPALLQKRAVAGAVLVSAVSATTFYSLLFALSLLFQHDRGLTPLSTGLAFLPLTAFVALGSFTSGPMLRRHGALHVVGGAFLAYAAGFLILIPAIPQAGIWPMMPAMLLIGFAAGLITPAATGAVMAGVGPEKAGVAAGVVNAARQAGAALGVALGGGLIVARGSPGAGLVPLVWSAAGLSIAAALVWWVSGRGNG